MINHFHHPTKKTLYSILKLSWKRNVDQPPPYLNNVTPFKMNQKEEVFVMFVQIILNTCTSS